MSGKKYDEEAEVGTTIVGPGRLYICYQCSASEERIVRPFRREKKRVAVLETDSVMMRLLAFPSLFFLKLNAVISVNVCSSILDIHSPSRRLRFDH